jgi:hypothetical protein
MLNESEDESLGVEQLPQDELDATPGQDHDPTPEAGAKLEDLRDIKGNRAATEDPAAAPGG